jgi:hypothetical protein
VDAVESRQPDAARQTGWDLCPRGWQGSLMCVPRVNPPATPLILNACGFAAVLLISALTLSGPTEGLSMSAFADEAF